MNTVIYARYSSDNQREESIEGQLRECKEYCERHNLTIVGTYIDRALSAKTDDRPQFQKMISDSKQKQFEIVLVWKLDRFARNRYDSASYRAILKRNSVKVKSAKEEISDGPEGIILEAMLEGMAEYYSAELSVKVKRGQKENALKCLATGGMVPFGYKVNPTSKKYEIDTVSAPIVHEIFTRYADGQTVKEITTAMKEKCLFAGLKYKYDSKSTLHNLLKNRRYMGEYRYGEIVIPDGMPALVDKDLFKQVADRMAKNKHKTGGLKSNADYILTTKLFCGKCGTMMVGVSGTSKSGKIHNYYKCGNAVHRKSCDKKTVKKDQIEQLVLSLVREVVLQDDVIDKLADAIIELQGRENTTIPFIETQLADTQKRIDNLINAVMDGLNSDSIKAKLAELESAKADLEIAIAKEKIDKPPLTKEQIVFWISRWKDGDFNDVKYCQTLVDVFVNSIFLYDDEVRIAFNWADGNRTVKLNDVEKCDNDGDFDGVSECSHIVRCTPVYCGKSEPFAVGEGFGFVLWL
ncbi:recombinase RecD [Clostridia bacterium]|nr:recombinase RecD [Clostridia bacterium]